MESRYILVSCKSSVSLRDVVRAPQFAAEKVSSLGKDWHRGCLKCAKCKKTLAPGSHAEVNIVNTN